MSLFGQSQQTSNPFGSSQSKPAGGLFGASTNTSQPQQGSSLFGGLTTQQQPQQQQGGGLFGQSTQQAAPSGGLFGQSTQQQPQLGGSMFGASQQQQPQQASQSMFGAQNQQQQQSAFGASGLGQSSLPQLGSSTYQQLGASAGPREKGVLQQMMVLAEKWNPKSPNTVFQHYFYNQVPPNNVPFYAPAQFEDEKKWEEALDKKPNEGAVPALARGFQEMAARLTVQVQAVNALQARLHEINDSLSAMMEKHDLEYTVRATDARRKHTALSQRCLSLAAKVQVLRNKGYVMDSAEEELKKKLSQIEKQAFDPVLQGRQEEIWARMSAVRTRARFLQEEAEKLGSKGKQGEEDQVDEETMKAVKKILGDFDVQLTHLDKEVLDIKTDFEAWQGNSRPVVNGAARS